jgi:sugar phosphate isomerase/epimerase
MAKTSLAHLTVLDLAPPEVALVAAKAGFDHFGLRLHPVRPGEEPPPLCGDTSMRRELLAILADTGVTLFDVEAFRLHKASDFGKIETAMEIAAFLNARNALVFIDERDHGLAVDLYSKFCDLSAIYGLDASLEFMPWLGVCSFDIAMRILADAKKPNARLLLDALHFFRAQTPLEVLKSLDPALLNYAQVCDAPYAAPPNLDEIADEARYNRQFPGEGELPVVEFVAGLPRDLVLSPEVATANIAGSVSGLERAKRAYQSTKRVLDLANDRRSQM